MPLVLLLLLTGFQSVRGEWAGSLATDHQTTNIRLDLQRNQTSISGSVAIADHVFPIQGGTIQGDSITFWISLPMRGRLSRQRFSVAIEGERLQMRALGSTAILAPVPFMTEERVTERLCGLFRLWGTIKFFHPYLADRPIDWDRVLLDTIASVESAKNREEYAAALDEMLRPLDDPRTHVLQSPTPSVKTSIENPREIVRSGYYPQIGQSTAGYFVDWEAVPSPRAYLVNLPEGIQVVMRTTEPAAPSNTINTTEKTYGTSLPSRSQRLLGLARLWNTIRYFYGYQEDLGDWGSALRMAIPEFSSAATWRRYIFAIARLMSKTHDSHSSFPELFAQLGSLPDIDVQPIQGQPVVTRVGPDVRGIKPGDVIVAVNGETSRQREQYLLDIYPHSTPQAGRLMADRLLLAGPAPTVKVRIKRQHGEEVDLNLTRSPISFSEPRLPLYGLLSSGFGYIDLTRLEPNEVDRAFETVMNTQGLILDLRGYPRGTLQLVSSRLAAKKVAAALIKTTIWHGPDPKCVTVRREVQYVRPGKKPIYKGKVVVLINAEAISQAEHMCLFLEAAAHPTFIGSPTKGADGEVTNTVLPGAVQVNFAAMEVRHADGRPLQDVGILPDLWVEPMITDVRQGHDELMDTAIHFLKSESAFKTN